jgi:hypothetical protein
MHALIAGAYSAVDFPFTLVRHVVIAQRSTYRSYIIGMLYLFSGMHSPHTVFAQRLSYRSCFTAVAYRSSRSHACQSVSHRPSLLLGSVLLLLELIARDSHGCRA